MNNKQVRALFAREWKEVLRVKPHLTCDLPAKREAFCLLVDNLEREGVVSEKVANSVVLSEDSAPLECVHVDTCLSCYWGGHHLPHCQIPVYPGITLKEIKRSLLSEVSEGAIAGEWGYNTLENTAYLNKLRAAIRRIKPAKKGQRTFFKDIEEGGESSETVYAFFIFKEV